MYQQASLAGSGPLLARTSRRIIGSQTSHLCALLALGVVLGIGAAAPVLSAQESVPQFKADVSIVRIDVIATDDDGHFVDDLDISEFVLYVDGEVRELTQAQLVDLRTASAVAMGPLVERAAHANETAPAVPPSDVAPLADAVRASDLGAMIFLIDTAWLSYWSERRFIKAWGELAAATDGYQAPKAVFLMGPYGSVLEVMALTSDPAAMRRAGPELEEMIESINMGRLDSLVGAVVPDEWAQSAGSMDDRRDDLRSLEVLEALARSLSFRQGRKALVWVSAGVQTMHYGMFVTIAPRIAEQLRRLARTANSANTSIYALDPTLVTERYGKRRSSSVKSRIGPADEFLDDPWDTQVLKFDGLRDSLRVVAKSTGGTAYPFTTKVGEALDEIRSDVERFYLLGFADAAEADGGYHEIRVETTRPDVRVRARNGYTALPPEQLASLRASVDAVYPEFNDTSELEFAIYRSWDDDGAPRLQVALELAPGGDVEAAREPDRAYQLELSAIDENGRPDTRSAVVSWGSSAPEPRPAVYVYDWPLRYGSYEIRVALADRTTLDAAAGRATVEFRDPGEGWRVTDAIILGNGPAGVPEPLVGRAMQGVEPTGVYFECWTDAEPQVDAVLSMGDGISLPVNVDRMDEGRYRVLVSLAGAPLPPGGVINIDAVDPGSGDERSFTIDITAQGVRVH